VPTNSAIFFFIIKSSPVYKDREQLWQHLINSDLPVADETAFEFLRIEAGQPRLAHELTTDYIPLEANLWDDVSFTKGCYIGQEIIARMESRGKLAKKLTRLTTSSPIPSDGKLTANGKNAGTLTSTAVGPVGVVALGYVKTAVLDAQTPLLINDIPLILAD
jgi:aminomethyltransferase